jgi:peptidylprolyl isomerase
MKSTQSMVFTRLFALALICAITAACSANVTVVTQTPQVTVSCVGVKDPTDNPPPGGSAKQWPAPDNVTDPTHSYCAIITTKNGRIVAELYPKIAPKNVNSFVFLAKQGFYDGLTWHRVLPGFVAQTGDPTGTGAGGAGYTVPLEVNPSLKYDREGRLGMARSGDPNSAANQFFITLAPQPGLDPGQGNDGYTIIGTVVEGMNVVKLITARDPSQNPNAPPGDLLVSVRVVDVTNTQ